MMKVLLRFVLLTIVLSTGTALADPSACLMCHDPEDLSGRDAVAVKEALSDPALPAHGRFADLSIEEVKALLEALAE